MKYKIHKQSYSFGPSSVCGRPAYSPEHQKESWKGVNCKNCLKIKDSQSNDSTQEKKE